VPVWQDVLADVETPLGAYWKLAHDEPVSFLLESVTGGERLARYSVIGVRPRAVVTAQDGQTTMGGATLDGEALAAVWGQCARIDRTAAAGLPKFLGGAVGFVSYDYARTIERLPDAPPDDLGLPTLTFLVTDTVVVFDHAKNLIRVVSLAEPGEAGEAAARAEISRIVERLKAPLPALPSDSHEPHDVRANRSREDFLAAVERVQEYILAGDCIQVVPSLRFSTRLDAHPVTLYRAVRSINPSPYMFLLRLGGTDVVGASPELLVSLEGRTATVRPIAGTRPRGETPADDDRLATELLADEKERAEHVMLVDLGRNDLGRVCEYGSVGVDDLMVIERYSHVMHIVSSVTGRLREGEDGVSLVRACFPAGTVSGAPKVRAMQIIDELEPNRRGLYAGAVGYLGATGDLDLAIAIRTILVKDGTAHVQAGAGIVADSDPASEYEECANKAKAALRAIEAAQRGL
jgi:anthranilate synthase component I